MNLNDWFEINFFFLRSETYIATFWICMDAVRSSVEVVFNNFLLKDSTDRSKFSSDQKLLFIARKPKPPFNFREHSL